MTIMTDEAQMDLFVAFLKQNLRTLPIAKEQCDGIEKNMEYALHQTKSFEAAIDGDVQKAIRERILAISEQCK